MRINWKLPTDVPHYIKTGSMWEKKRLTNFLRVGDSNIHIKTVLGLFLLQLCLNKMNTMLNICNRKIAYINHRVDITVCRSSAQAQFVPAPRRWAAWLQNGGQRRRGAPSGQSSQTCPCLAPPEPLEKEKTCD